MQEPRLTGARPNNSGYNASEPAVQNFEMSSMSPSNSPGNDTKPSRTGRWIIAGLLLGVLCGVLLGEYCERLQVVGQAYVGLLQMTVLPYLVISLIAKMGRLDVEQAKKLGFTALAVLLILWVLGIVLIVLVTSIFSLPPRSRVLQSFAGGGRWRLAGFLVSFYSHECLPLTGG